MFAIYKRELKSYFFTAIGYVVIAAFVFFAALFFTLYNIYGDSASMSSLFSSLLLIYVFVVPILTMKTLSEERKQKTDQALLTAPVGMWSIVLGKYLAALTVYGIGLSSTLIFAVVIKIVSTLDALAVIGSILGMLLIGASMIAIGVFISSLTESQVIAAVASFLVMLFLFLLDSISSVVQNGFFQNVLKYISINQRYNNFSVGILNLSDAVFYLSVMAVFLFFTVRVLDKRRWS